MLSNNKPLKRTPARMCVLRLKNVKYGKNCFLLERTETFTVITKKQYFHRVEENFNCAEFF